MHCFFPFACFPLQFSFFLEMCFSQNSGSWIFLSSLRSLERSSKQGVRVKKSSETQSGHLGREKEITEEKRLNKGYRDLPFLFGSLPWTILEGEVVELPEYSFLTLTFALPRNLMHFNRMSSTIPRCKQQPTTPTSMLNISNSIYQVRYPAENTRKC